MELCGLATQRRDADRVLEQAARVAVVSVRAGGGERAQRLADVGVSRRRSRRRPRARRARSPPRGTRRSRRARPRRGAASASARPGRRPRRPRPSAPAPGACRRSARRARAREPRRPRRSVRRADRRRSTPARRRGRWRRRARAPGTRRRRACAGAPSWRPRTHPRRSCPRRARRSWSRLESMSQTRWYARRDGRCAAVPRRPLRRRGRRAGRPRRTAVRRRLGRGARGAIHAQPLQRRPCDACPSRPRPQGALYRDWLAEGILERRRRVVVGSRARSSSARTASPASGTGSIVSLDGEAVRRQHRPSARAHASAHPRGAPAACCARRACSPSRSSCSRMRLSRSPLPRRPPDLAVDGTRLWRLDADAADGLEGRQLLIADGHHRYESAVELGEELGVPVRIMALVVPTDDAGLQLFPTHSVFARRPDLASGSRRRAVPEPGGRARSARRGRLRARGGRQVSARIASASSTAATASSTSSSSIGTASTASATRPDVEEAVAAVDDGSADAAFLLRPPRVEDVFAVARRGETMPPKSTYFFPKPLSGLLFHPVAP